MNTTRPCFLPIFILLPIYGDTRNKLINKFYNYLHTFLDKPHSEDYNHDNLSF